MIGGVRGTKVQSPDQTKRRVVLVASSPMTLERFLSAQVRALADEYDVCLATNVRLAPEFARRLPKEARILDVDLERRPAPYKDLSALRALYMFFRRVRPAVVHSFTSKAGLIAMMAAYLARVPVRIHSFTGQAWSTRTGFARVLLRSADRLTANLATDVLVDGHSQRAFLLREGIIAEGGSSVLGDGTLGGVDTSLFAPDADERRATRSELRIPTDALVFLFVGVLVFEKGVLELADAFRRVSALLPNAFLVLVGPDEEGLLPLPPLDGLDRVRVVGPTLHPERYMKAADVLCLPSHREALGFVIIEAASTGVPAIASRIYGIADAVVDDETGVLVTVRDAQSLADAMVAMASKPEWRVSLAEAARKRALERFPQSRLTAELLDYYARRMAAKRN